MKLILASSSPRRIELIKKLNLDYIVLPSEIDERKLIKVKKNMDPISYSSFLSLKKGEDVFSKIDLKKDEVIISCDTIVFHKGNILNKPKDNKEAKVMLKELSNETHEVITSTTLISLNKKVSFSSITKVYFNKLSEEYIDEFLKNNYVLDKAGAYAIQDDSKNHLVKKIEGSYFNVVGFPLEDITLHLKEFID